MNIDIINKRNYPVNDKLKEVLDKKMSKIAKYFEADVPVKVYLKSEGNRCKLEIQLTLEKNFLSAEAIADNMYDAIDLALPKIEKQIIKHRSRFDKKLKKSAFRENPVFEEYEKKIEKIVKVKNFDVEPMSVEEAIFQMDLSGHEFFVFLEEKSNSLQVLYKRFDGDYGVLVPNA